MLTSLKSIISTEGLPILAKNNGTCKISVLISCLASAVANNVTFLLDVSMYAFSIIANIGLTNNINQFYEPMTACSVLKCQFRSFRRSCVASKSSFTFSVAGSIKQLDVEFTSRTFNGSSLERTHFKGFGGTFFFKMPNKCGRTHY